MLIHLNEDFSKDFIPRILIGFYNFRVSNFGVPSGSRADLHARPKGPSLRMDGWDGMGWDGWMNGTEYQKCPSIFFGYIEHVYTYLYIYSKIVTIILMGFKISCQFGDCGQNFQNYCR